jgi:integrase
MLLSQAKIKTLRVSIKDQNIRDSKGLYLRVRPGIPGDKITSAAWELRTTKDGKTQKLVLGHLESMSVEAARRERDRLTGAGNNLARDVSDCINEYRRLVTDHQKSGAGSELYLRELDKHIGHRKIASVSRADLTKLIKDWASERGARTADRYLSQIRGIFNLAVEHGVIDQSPLLGVSKRITGYVATKRDRVLSDDEIRQLFNWGDHQNARLLRFLLLTGLRRTEGRKGHKEGDRWIVPASISKNTKAHWVHITPLAAAQLDEKADFSVGTKALSEWLKSRQDCDNHYTAHDTRRTAATRMGGAGVDPFIIERCLNHSMQGVAGIYNRSEYEKQRITAALTLETAIIEVLRNG